MMGRMAAWWRGARWLRSVEHFLDAVGDSSVLWVRKTAQKVIFQIPVFPCVPESRVVGEHFGLLFGSGTRDLAELWRTKTRVSWISSLVSNYRIFPQLFWNIQDSRFAVLNYKDSRRRDSRRPWVLPHMWSPPPGPINLKPAIFHKPSSCVSMSTSRSFMNHLDRDWWTLSY